MLQDLSWFILQNSLPPIKDHKKLKMHINYPNSASNGEVTQRKYVYIFSWWNCTTASAGIYRGLGKIMH